jgi:hypothetical protein
MPNTPQSWAALLDTATSESNSIPGLLKERLSFAFLFAVVFPQRFGVGLLRLLDCSLHQ